MIHGTTLKKACFISVLQSVLCLFDQLKFVSGLQWTFRGLLSSVSKEECDLGRLILNVVAVILNIVPNS